MWPSIYRGDWAGFWVFWRSVLAGTARKCLGNKGENYFLPHLLEEKKRFSWEKLLESILDVADSK